NQFIDDEAGCSDDEDEEDDDDYMDGCETFNQSPSSSKKRQRVTRNERAAKRKHVKKSQVVPKERVFTVDTKLTQEDYKVLKRRDVLRDYLNFKRQIATWIDLSEELSRWCNIVP